MSWERLGREVARRRGQLRLTQAELARRGGFSVPTLNAIENDRAGRLSKRLRLALEQALDWEPGSVDAVLDGQQPRMAVTAAQEAPADLSGGDSEQVAAQRFAVVQRLLRMRRAFVEHRDEMPEAVRAAMQEEVTAATRETEEALIWMLPWLGETERGEAIRILAELQQS